MLKSLQSRGGQGACESPPKADNGDEEVPYTTSLVDIEDAVPRDAVPHAQDNFLQGLEYYSTQDVLLSCKLSTPVTDPEANKDKELWELYVLRPIDATPLADGIIFSRVLRLPLALKPPGKEATMSPIRKLDINLTAK